MYLVDTNVISEARKGVHANDGVKAFFADVRRRRTRVFLSVITLGELRRGVELIRYRHDFQQARRLHRWLDALLRDYANQILDVDADIASLWGYLGVPHPENQLDKLIAATALIHDLVLVTRNVKHFQIPGLKTINPFDACND